MADLRAFGLLFLIAVVLWGCVGDPTPTPGADLCAPAWTRLVAAEGTVSALETLADGLLATAGMPTPTGGAVATSLPASDCEPVLLECLAEVSRLWNCCADATAAASGGLWPTPTAAPDLCRRCIVDAAEPFGCPPGYVCELCEECKWLCVPADSPRGGCNFCSGLVIP